MRSDENAVFVGGCGRSGTTLFRELLNRHPRIACGPETSLFGLPFDVRHIAPYWGLDEGELRKLAAQCTHLTEFAAAFFRKHLLDVEHKPRWADKTPNNVRALAHILTWYPKGKFLHIIRDGRDVVCSLRHHPSERYVRGRLVPVKHDHPIDQCARRWVRDTSFGLAYAGHPRYLEVRYEALVMDPQCELKRVCDFLGEDFEPGMIHSIPTSESNPTSGRFINNPNADGPISDRSLGRWTRDLSTEERESFANIAGELLIAVGYVEDQGWVNDNTAFEATLLEADGRQRAN